MNGVQLASIVGLLLALGLTPALAFYKHGNKDGPLNPSRHLSITWGTCIALLALVLLWERPDRLKTYQPPPLKFNRIATPLLISNLFFISNRFLIAPVAL